MEQGRCVEIVNRLYSFVNFPFYVINSDYETIYCKPSQIDCFWPKSVLSYLFKKYKETLIPYPFPYIFADEDGIFIDIIPLPDSKYSLIGPVLSHNVNVRNVATRYSKLMTRDELSTLRTISLNCPMADTVFISDALSTFYELVYHKVISVDDIIKKICLQKKIIKI